MKGQNLWEARLLQIAAADGSLSAVYATAETNAKGRNWFAEPVLCLGLFELPAKGTREAERFPAGFDLDPLDGGVPMHADTNFLKYVPTSGIEECAEQLQLEAIAWIEEQERKAESDEANNEARCMDEADLRRRGETP